VWLASPFSPPTAHSRIKLLFLDCCARTNWIGNSFFNHTDAGGGARLAWPELGAGLQRRCQEVTATRGNAWVSHTGESSMQRGGGAARWHNADQSRTTRGEMQPRHSKTHNRAGIAGEEGEGVDWI
jgi:hypothetical protein